MEVKSDQKTETQECKILQINFRNELQYIKKVLNAESWASTGGSWTENSSKVLLKKFESKYAIAFNSGTSTPHAALLALELSPAMR